MPTKHPRVVAILDGAGSWGSGAAVAGSVAACLEGKWRAELPANPRTIGADLECCLGAVSQSLKNDEFGHDFSFTSVLLTDAEAWIVSCGWYGILHVAQSSVRVVYRPDAWVEQAVDDGVLTSEEAATHKLRGVFAGTLVSADKPLELHISAAPLNGRLVVTSMELFRTLVNTASKQRIDELSATQLHRLDSDVQALNRPLVLVTSDV